MKEQWDQENPSYLKNLKAQYWAVPKGLMVWNVRNVCLNGQKTYIFPSLSLENIRKLEQKLKKVKDETVGKKTVKRQDFLIMEKTV